MSTNRRQSYTYTDEEVVYGGHWTKVIWAVNGSSGDYIASSYGYLYPYVYFVFPEPAIKFEYWGLKQSFLGSLNMCIDCPLTDDAPAPTVTTAEPRPTDTSMGSVTIGPPEILFATEYPSPELHTMLLEVRSGRESMQFVSFALEFPNQPTQTPDSSIPIPSTTRSSSTTLSATIAIPTANFPASDIVTTSLTASSRSSSNFITRTSASGSSSRSDPSSVISSAPISESSSSSSSVVVPTLSPSATSDNPSSNETRGPHAGVIAGGAIAGVVILALVLFFLCSTRYKSRRRREEAEEKNTMVVDQIDSKFPFLFRADSSSRRKQGNLTSLLSSVNVDVEQPRGKSRQMQSLAVQVHISRSQTSSQVTQEDFGPTSLLHPSAPGHRISGTHRTLSRNTSSRSSFNSSLDQISEVGFERAIDAGRISMTLDSPVSGTLPPAY